MQEGQKMKMTIFNGSPRAEKGNTHIIAEAFAKGAARAGAEVENVFLKTKRIEHCRGCYVCWIKTPGKCVIKDDMAELLEKFAGSDIAVFATPLYVDNVTGITKTFMDRLIPLADPHFEKDDGGECRHIMNMEKAPKIVVISNCGFPEQSHFQVLELLFRRIARNMHSEVIAEIYRGGGAILKEAPFILKPIVHRYLIHVQHAGKEIVENGRISEATKQKLRKPLFPEDKYIAAANKLFDAELSKLR